jgi:hypothetical protein
LCKTTSIEMYGSIPVRYRYFSTRCYPKPVLWIRTHFFRIRIHKLFFSDSDSDSDTDSDSDF